ncbi:MAG: hypothetical protein C0505_03275 [Leptothrix sp. (in: Bacteria)]|nr:hypothetical protein [Leptothrix sp. (in: b-proteobacteria)]
MISNAPMPRPDSSNTRARPVEAARATMPAVQGDANEAADALASADAADLQLLRLVGCVALATALLALATGLSV